MNTVKSRRRFTDDAIETLQEHEWFGNVRELKNTIERIVIMSSKTEDHCRSDLPEIGTSNDSPASSFRFPTFKAATDAYQREFILTQASRVRRQVAKAAEDMGVDRSHLYRRMRNLGIQSTERARVASIKRDKQSIAYPSFHDLRS